jgi:N-formylglutamate deformylase
MTGSSAETGAERAVSHRPSVARPHPVDPAPAVRRIQPTEPAAPVVACLPHGGRDYPADLDGALAVDPATLWADWLTPELYGFLPEVGVTTIVTRMSRFVADPNRDPAGEQHGGFWTSVVPARTPDGRSVYREPLSPAAISGRIRLAHTPFHRELDRAIGQLLARFRRVLVLDLHSFGVVAGVDVILGDRHGTTAAAKTVRLIAGTLTAHGLAVARNQRFAGGWTVRRFGGDTRVDAVQVELSQHRYLVTGPGAPLREPPRGDFEQTQSLLRAAISEIARPLTACWRRDQSPGPP